MAPSIDELLQEPTKPVNLTNPEEFKIHISKLQDEHFDEDMFNLVVRVLVSNSEKSAQISVVKSYVDELIKRGIADETDRKDLGAELRSKAKKLKETIITEKRYSHFTEEHDLSSVINDLPVKVSLRIPEGYRLDKECGILRATNNGGYLEVCPYIILPVQIVVDKSDTSGDKLCRIIRWNEQSQKWQYHPYPISIKHLQEPREITRLNGAGVIAIGTKYNKALADFFVDFINCNNMLTNLPTNVAIHACGWTEERLFFPFTTQEKGEDLIFTGKPNTTVNGIKSAVEELPVGSMDEAKNIINTLSGNPVFAVMLAGCLASPLVPFMKGILDENIGIDLYGKTTSGKTTIQIFATNLIYGLGDELKTSWANAKVAGIWRKAEAINNLPYCIDDNHRAGEHLAGVSHDLINRREGDKSAKTGDSWSSKDNTKDQYTGVILFNGEVSISTKSPQDSAGIYGRIIMINQKPFPSDYDHFKVEALKNRVYSNRGHFAKPWIEHIANIDSNSLKNEVAFISEVFEDKDADALYGRLVTKASLLVWCLKEFNKLFNMNVDVDRAIELLKQSMNSATNNVNVADKIVKRIVESVFQRIVYYQAQGYSKYIMFNHLPNERNGNINVVYKDNDYLIITLDVLKEILKGTSHSEESARNLLASAGYIEKAASRRHSRPKQSHESQKAHMTGFKFKYEDIKDFIPEEADYDEADDIIADVPIMI
ncbi:DUF927 domain-containing protein [Calidifontibacillus oryziterrae]|uniref:DUF927 domain-containing protein n=1 Tax=Calidifontibacillus oryziterrae TaxID=1191699 RepID=UPI000306FA4A|nr:DUF927 domain-containing protein [Calidifontibacillus oryziterrae]